MKRKRNERVLVHYTSEAQYKRSKARLNEIAQQDANSSGRSVVIVSGTTGKVLKWVHPARTNPSFRKTKKAARKVGAHIPSSRRAKRALAVPGQTTVSRALAGLLRAALGKRKTARARLVRNGRAIRLEVSR